MAETGAASTSSGQAQASDVTPADAAATSTVDAAPSEPRKQSTQPANPAVEDDPEEDWGDGIKLKRSEARERIKRQREFDRASHTRMQEAAKLRKEAAAEAERAKKQLEEANIDAILQARGIDPNVWAEQRLTQALKRQTMTPEQIENEKLRQENEELKAANKRTEEQKKQDLHNQQKGQYFQHFDQLIGDTVTKFGKLPRTPTAVGKVADVMIEYLDPETGQLQIDPMLAAEIAYDNVSADTRQILEMIVDSGDPRADAQLEELIGPKVMAAVQRRAIAKAQGLPPAGPPQRPRTPPASPQTNPGQFMTMEEARKRAGIRN